MKDNLWQEKSDFEAALIGVNSDPSPDEIRATLDTDNGTNDIDDQLYRLRDEGYDDISGEADAAWKTVKE